LRREGRSLRPPIFLETISRPALILGESGDLGAVQALARGEKTGNLQRSPNDSRGEIEAWIQITDQGWKWAIWQSLSLNSSGNQKHSILPAQGFYFLGSRGAVAEMVSGLDLQYLEKMGNKRFVGVAMLK